jgi:hypothetical protein
MDVLKIRGNKINLRFQFNFNLEEKENLVGD